MALAWSAFVASFQVLGGKEPSRRLATSWCMSLSVSTSISESLVVTVVHVSLAEVSSRLVVKTVSGGWRLRSSF